MLNENEDVLLITMKVRLFAFQVYHILILFIKLIIINDFTLLVIIFGLLISLSSILYSICIILFFYPSLGITYSITQGDGTTTTMTRSKNKRGQFVSPSLLTGKPIVLRSKSQPKAQPQRQSLAFINSSSINDIANNNGVFQQLETEISTNVNNENSSKIAVKMGVYCYIELSKISNIKRDLRLKSMIIKKFEDEKAGEKYYVAIKSKNYYFKKTYEKNQHKQHYQSVAEHSPFTFGLFTKLFDNAVE